MKKKLAYALLYGCLVFGLTACGGKEKSENSAEKSAATEVSSQTEKEIAGNESENAASEAGGQQETDAAPASSSADVSLTKNAEGYYEIGSAEDFVAFARLINLEIPDVIAQSEHVGSQVSVEEHAILTADIDLSGAFTGEDAALLPVGGSYAYTSKVNGNVYDISGSFAGEFDGNGHTISGIHMDAGTYGMMCVGLFRLGTPENNDKEVYIHDLTIADSSFSGTNYVGAIAGGLPDRSVIENCTVAETVTVEAPVAEWDISSPVAAGGLAGAVQGMDEVFRGCVSYASVSGTIAGGILGNCGSTTSVIGCDNYGAVTGITAGGIVGVHEGSSYYEGLVIGCVNYGTVTAAEGKHARACGIVGDNCSTIRYCVNAGVVDGKSGDAYAVAKKDGSIGGCGNIGEIHGERTYPTELAYSWELGNYESRTEEEVNAIRGCTGEILVGQTEVEITPAKVSDAADGTLLKMLQDIGSEHGYGGWKQGEQFPVWDGEHGLEEYRLPTPAEETE